MIKVLSYHNKPELKEWAVNMAENHYKMDMLVTGAYGNVEDDASFKGCSVGCDARDICGSTVNPHSTTSQYFGFPEWLERLRDTLFEGLDAKSRKTFHVDFKKAIPVGVDLEPVRHQLAIARLGSLLKLYEDNDSFGIKSALTLVIRCHEAELNCQVCDWSAAESAAESAAWLAAESVALSVRSAAWSAAWSVRSAAESAALSVRAAAESAAELAWSAWSAAESAAYKQEAKMLIKLLSECK